MDKKVFGIRLRKYRTDKHYSVAELSELANIAEDHIRRLETGEKGVTLQSLVKLSNALQVSPDCLIEGNDFLQPEFLNSLSFSKIESLTNKQLHLLSRIVELVSQYFLNAEQDQGQIGKRIHDYRVKQGISRISLSELTNTSNAYLSNMENGLAKVSITALENISKALNTDINYFLRDTSPYSERIVLEKTMQDSQKRLSKEDFDFLLNLYFYLISNFLTN